MTISTEFNRYEWSKEYDWSKYICAKKPAKKFKNVEEMLRCMETMDED